MRVATFVRAATLLAGLILATVAPAEAQTRDQRRTGGPGGGRPAAGPDVGDPAPALKLTRLSGEEVSLSDLWAGRHLLVVVGSCTAPEFRERAAAISRFSGEFGGDIGIAVIYVLEAHPAGAVGPFGSHPDIVQANTAAGCSVPVHKDLEARREAARLATRTLGLEVPVFVDGMDDAAWKAFGKPVSGAFLIDRQGYVVAPQLAYSPADMEANARLLLQLQPASDPAPPAKPGGGSR
jgi:hypothetical protein